MSDPSGTVRFVESDALVRYQFGLRTAEFLVCCRCGVYIGARTEIEGRRFGIINVRALVEPMPSFVVEPMSYDGETATSRGARRAKRWTPLVEA